MVQPFTVWYPTILPEKCDGCISLENPRCVEFCPNKVFEIRDGKAVVAQPHKCISGCTACEPLCHKKAISFPTRSTLYSKAVRDDKDLLRKTTCRVCGKQYWTNSERDICFDCES